MDEPTAIGTDGIKEWYWDDRTTQWYRDGKLHRDEDKPAVVWADGSKVWYREGNLHRDGDEPAIVWANGAKEWFRDGVKRISPKSKGN